MYINSHHTQNLAKLIQRSDNYFPTYNLGSFYKHTIIFSHYKTSQRMFSDARAIKPCGQQEKLHTLLLVINTYANTT